METKVCNHCHEEKEIDKFPFRNTIKNIRHGSCIICWKEIRKKYYKKNKLAPLNKNRRNKKRNRDWYNEYKSKLKCERCPENNPACLDFHHDDPTIKDFEVSALINATYSIKKILEEIDKCRVLCANCHRKLHFEDKKCTHSSMEEHLATNQEVDGFDPL